MTDPGTCPLCGRPNACALASACGDKKDCWCRRVEIPRAVLDSIPAEAAGVACVCRECAEAKPGDGNAAATTTVIAVAAALLFAPSRPARAANLEDFSSDPAQRGWRMVGDTSAFHWDAAAGALSATWDSRRPNAFFALPLATPLTKADDFSFGFKLRLTDIQPGVDPSKPGTFELAAGWLQLAQAAAPGFERGVFLRSTNLVEWTWFPSAQGVSASVSPAIVPADGRLPWGYSDSYMELAVETDYRFRLDYTGSDHTLRSTVTVDGEPGPGLQPLVLPGDFTDFRVDALSITSYSDAGQSPRFAGSILATGWIDDVTWEVPGPPVGTIRIRDDGVGPVVSVGTRVGWTYSLESSGDMASWSKIGNALEGTGSEVVFHADGGPPGEARFFRVGAVGL